MRAKQARCERKARGSKTTENASAKHEAQGSEATENANGKPKGAKRLSRPTVLAFLAFLCVSEHFDLIETNFFFKSFCERKLRNKREQSEQDESAKCKAGGSEETENASAKLKARGSEVTNYIINASAKHKVKEREAI